MANILHLFKCFKMAKVQTENKKRHFKSILFFSAQKLLFVLNFPKGCPVNASLCCWGGNAKWRNRTERSGGQKKEMCPRDGVAGWLALQNDLNNKWLSPYHVGPFVLIIIIMQYKWTRERFVRRIFVLAHKLTRVDGSKARSFACLLWMRHGTYYYYYYFTIFDALYWMNNER